MKRSGVIAGTERIGDAPHEAHLIVYHATDLHENTFCELGVTPSAAQVKSRELLSK